MISPVYPGRDDAYDFAAVRRFADFGLHAEACTEHYVGRVSAISFHADPPPGPVFRVCNNVALLHEVSAADDRLVK